MSKRATNLMINVACLVQDAGYEQEAFTKALYSIMCIIKCATNLVDQDGQLSKQTFIK